MSPFTTKGFHHITMVSRSAPRTVAFYGDALGIPLVKRTVNFDDPASWHLYFGQEGGDPGTILTFFEWPHARPGGWGIGGIHHLALGVAALGLAAALPLSAAAQMPSDAEFQRVVDEAYASFKDLKEGANANYIPILDTVPSELFGVAIVTKEGKVCTAGDVDYKFSIQSVSKPFTASLVMQQQGPDVVAESVARWGNLCKRASG